MRRARRTIPTDPDTRMQARMSQVEGRPEPWRSGLSSDDGPLRIIRGTVSTTAPSIVRGSGFFILAKNGVGDITVQWDETFAATPTVVCGGGGGLTTGAAQSESTTGVRLLRGRPGVAFDDGQLHFIAIGPAT